MDVDTTSKQNSHEKILSDFSQKNIDILIGTQMVAKGLDFPNVTLVGVVSADTMLNIDDFRSSERSFDLLEQVSGRAGRANKTGRAIIQTYSPEHNAVVFASQHNYLKFYQNEIAMRKAMWYPPFCEMVSVLFSAGFEKTVAQCARAFAQNISHIKNMGQKMQILGPVPATITKIKNKYRWRILIKCENSDMLTDALVSATDECYKNNNFEKVSIVIDKNPNNIY
jgi:primosomal protein N' (replication factor Y)